MEIVSVNTAASKTTMESCKNCGVALQGNYCSDCGQKRIVERITVRTIFQDLYQFAVNRTQ